MKEYESKIGLDAKHIELCPIMTIARKREFSEEKKKEKQKEESECFETYIDNKIKEVYENENISRIALNRFYRKYNNI